MRKCDEKARRMNLQLFAEEKTEAPTPKKRREARERGQVFQSVELTSAVILLASFMAMRVTGTGLPALFAGTMESLLAQNSRGDLTVDQVFEMARLAVLDGGVVAAPLLGVAFAAALAGTMSQVGFVFSIRPLAVNLSRINPAEGFKRIFSKRGYVELVKATLRVLLVGYVALTTIRQHDDLVPRLAEADLVSGIAYILTLCFTFLWKSGLLLLAVAVADYAYQRWEYNQSLRMTRRELKDELKDTEGDPRIRARVRERQRLMARQRMLADVARAQVVVTNPTEYAVALRYVPDEMDAPAVVAKGKGFLAIKIKELAKKHGITIMQDPPLARALHQAVGLGELIPEELYHAVAEVLAFVWRLKGGIL